MIKISQKTLDDLEFDAVIAQVAAFAITTLGREEIEQLIARIARLDFPAVSDRTSTFEEQ